MGFGVWGLGFGLLKKNKTNNKLHPFHPSLPSEIVRIPSHTHTLSQSLAHPPARSRTRTIQALLLFLKCCSSNSQSQLKQRNPTPERPIQSVGYPERTFHSALAGTIGAFLVWGNSNGLNYQIGLYLLSRIQTSLIKSQLGIDLPKRRRLFAIFSACVWGIVMFQFEDQPTSLHPSLRHSMEEIYRPKNFLSSFITWWRANSMRGQPSTQLAHRTQESTTVGSSPHQ